MKAIETAQGHREEDECDEKTVGTTPPHEGD